MQLCSYSSAVRLDRTHSTAHSARPARRGHTRRARERRLARRVPEGTHPARDAAPLDARPVWLGRTRTLVFASPALLDPTLLTAQMLVFHARLASTQKRWAQQAARPACPEHSPAPSAPHPERCAHCALPARSQACLAGLLPRLANNVPEDTSQPPRARQRTPPAQSV